MTFVDRLTHRHDDGTETVRWRARYRDPAGRERSKSFDRKSDAEQYLAQVTSDLLRSEWADPDRGRTRVRDWAPRWLATKRKLKPKTRYGYESLLRTRILPELGDLSLARLERVTIEEWLSGMVEEGLSTSRTRQAFNVLAAMLDAAVANAMIARNVARGVELPRLVTAPRRFLHEEQVARLADAIDPAYRMLVLVLTYGCLRWSEAVALRRGRCDLLRRRLEILEAAVEVGSDLVWGAPKSHRVRTVSLPAFVCEELAYHLEALPETSDALVLTSKTGLALRNSDFRARHWKPALKGAELPDDLTPHELRHTGAALLIASGAGPKSVQAQLGHASIAITFDLYGHLFEGHLDEVMDHLDRRWREASSRANSRGSRKASDEVIELPRREA
ncbi:MAG: tyrosine-type recombinase/integrase [Nitriliruptorales bacterium]